MTASLLTDAKIGAATSTMTEERASAFLEGAKFARKAYESDLSRFREINAEMLAALNAIRNAVKNNEENVKVKADFIGSIIFGSAAEKVDAAIAKAEVLG